MYGTTGFFAGEIVLPVRLAHIFELAEKIELVAERQTCVIFLGGRFVPFQSTTVGDP